MTMPLPLHDVSCASLPAASLWLLAAVRCEAGVQVSDAGERIWLRWDAGNDAVLRAVTPIPGCRLFVFRGGSWFPLGKHLPADVPVSGFRPLDQVLLPAPVSPLPVPSLARPANPVSLTLIAERKPRPASALRCGLADLRTWALTVPNPRLALLQATHCAEEVLVLGKKLPELTRGRRFWGHAVLVPLGFRVEPALPESGLRQALELDEGDLALFETDHVNVIPRSALVPLTRAGLRLL
jgi:hypothetical protein